MGPLRGASEEAISDTWYACVLVSKIVYPMELRALRGIIIRTVAHLPTRMVQLWITLKGQLLDEKALNTKRRALKCNLLLSYPIRIWNYKCGAGKPSARGSIFEVNLFEKAYQGSTEQRLALVTNWLIATSSIDGLPCTTVTSLEQFTAIIAIASKMSLQIEKSMLLSRSNIHTEEDTSG